MSKGYFVSDKHFSSDIFLIDNAEDVIIIYVYRKIEFTFRFEKSGCIAFNQ